MWAAILTLTGSYNELLDYVIFAVVLFYILTIAGNLPVAPDPPGRAAALSRLGLSGPSPAVYRFRFVCGVGIIDEQRQSFTKLRWFKYRRHWCSGLLSMAKA